jgi:hypothetical protein
MSDIIRKIADLMDNNPGSELSGNTTQNRSDPIELKKPGEEDQPVMVPPLQAKLEILKKSEGIPNVYDGEGEEDAELAAIKKNAGLTAAQHEASEDNDVLG